MKAKKTKDMKTTIKKTTNKLLRYRYSKKILLIFVVLFALVGIYTLTRSRAAQPVPNNALGVFVGHQGSNVSNFSAQLGRDVEVAVSFFAMETWSTLLSGTGWNFDAFSTWMGADPKHKLTLAVPMVPRDIPSD